MIDTFAIEAEVTYIPAENSRFVKTKAHFSAKAEEEDRSNASVYVGATEQEACNKAIRDVASKMTIPNGVMISTMIIRKNYHYKNGIFSLGEA